jgi:hypothetical protein
MVSDLWFSVRDLRVGVESLVCWSLRFGVLVIEFMVKGWGTQTINSKPRIQNRIMYALTF